LLPCQRQLPRRSAALLLPRRRSWAHHAQWRHGSTTPMAAQPVPARRQPLTATLAGTLLSRSLASTLLPQLSSSCTTACLVLAGAVEPPPRRPRPWVTPRGQRTEKARRSCRWSGLSECFASLPHQNGSREEGWEVILLQSYFFTVWHNFTENSLRSFQ
jgi:hypothetical protein